jgi:hypothetical protein
LDIRRRRAGGPDPNQWLGGVALKPADGSKIERRSNSSINDQRVMSQRSKEWRWIVAATLHQVK